MVTFLKDIYSEELIKKQNLNERQVKAVLFIKQQGRITNSNYQEVNQTSHRTKQEMKIY